ncbi:MAG: amidase [Azospirillaceae bacterium]
MRQSAIPSGRTALSPSEYAGHDAVSLAGLVATGAVHPMELLNTAVAAVEALDPTLNAVVIRFEEMARAAIEQGLPEGPLRGVPFLLKDLTAHMAGTVTSCGWPPRAETISTIDTELVARFRQAGLVTFGKTAVPELAMDWSTESRLYGPTRNPWSPAHSTGTSSGGSAAAVAAGMVPVAHGNDGGGSIRVPASCCGLFGLKPSRHRNPAGPVVGDLWQGMICEHVLSRTVRDSAAVLDATAGIDVGAFHEAPAMPCSFAAAVNQAPRPLRIALSTEAPYGAPTHGDCRAAAEDAAALCESLGHHVERATPPLPDEGWQAFETFISVEYAADIAREAMTLDRDLTEADFPPVLWAMIERGRSIGGVEAALALSVLHRISRDLGRFFQAFDVVLTPTLAVPPVRLGHFGLDVTPEAHWKAYLGFMPYTHPFNIGGQPAMSVPLYWNQDGLPIGVQFAAPVGDEYTLFQLASQLEAARPWLDRTPRISLKGQ